MSESNVSGRRSSARVRYDPYDKGTVHSYIEVYERLLEPFRNSAATFLEIGVAGGASLRMWAEYFSHPNSRVIGVDVLDDRCAPGKAEFLLGDITLDNFCAELPSCDIVIDDGSHELADQKRSFSLLWPKVNPGGVYVIEDVQNDVCSAKLRRWHPELQLLDLRDKRAATTTSC